MKRPDKTLDSYKQYSIAWIAALSIERTAAAAMLDERHKPPRDFTPSASDINQYTWGQMNGHNIVIAVLPSGIYGTTAAAVTASHLSASLPHIKMALLVGIAGAIPQTKKEADGTGIVESIDTGRDIRLGDIVVGQPDGTAGGVVQYDLGKSKLGQVWERKGSLNQPPLALLAALSVLQSERELGDVKVPEYLETMWQEYPKLAESGSTGKPAYTHQGFENDVLFKAQYDHRGAPENCQQCDLSERVTRPDRNSTEPEVHFGIIASGNTLVKDALTRDKIAESTGQKCLCYEMEAAGIVSHFPCLVIRGICDYADSHKNDRWQPYAAATAAAFAKELLYHLLPADVATAVPLSEISAGK